VFAHNSPRRRDCLPRSSEPPSRSSTSCIYHEKLRDACTALSNLSTSSRKYPYSRASVPSQVVGTFTLSFERARGSAELTKPFCRCLASSWYVSM